MEKKLVTNHNTTFEYTLHQGGKHTVILINGAGGPIEGWFKLWHKLPLDYTMFAYNRLGIGKSSKPTIAQTGIVMVNDLRYLLNRIGLHPPYILVGHSFGGFIAHLFAKEYPQEVCGVLFLESSTVQDVLTQNHRITLKQRNSLSEVDHVETTIKHIIASNPFPHIPIRIVAGNKPALRWLFSPKIKQQRIQNQQALMSLSPYSNFVLANKSGHFPQLSEPEVCVRELHALVGDIQNFSKRR